MPFFDIHCDKCGHEWEALLKTNKHIPDCPACSSAFTKITYNKGPIMAGAARTRIMNRAENPSSPNFRVQVPRSYKKKKETTPSTTGKSS